MAHKNKLIPYFATKLSLVNGLDPNIDHSHYALSMIAAPLIEA